MTDRHWLARSYLSPPAQSFWRWSVGGDVVEWSDGTTIAFRQEVEFVLGRLAPYGLPPFGAVVLLLAACRASWHESHETVGIMRSLGGWVGTVGLMLSHEWLSDLVHGLNTVQGLPSDLRAPLDAKATLAELVFEDARHRWTREDSSEIVSALSEGVVADALAPDEVKSNALEWFRIERDTLAHGLKRVAAETLRLRARTGLDRRVVPATVDLSTVDSVRKLIAALRRDNELPGLGQLAHDLMAAVHLPRAVSAPDELPVGGVSDIANRGPLDRLLVSELANDDLTLAVRVALNEALYLRRESPPRTPQSSRMILIDSGIRLWGVSRVFAAAVTLAFVATANRKIPVKVYRSTQDGLMPVDLTTREGLEQHLEAVDAQPHSAPALRKFLGLAQLLEQPVDRVLITQEDVLQDAEFRSSLHSMQAEQLYIATVSRDGAYRLRTVSGNRDRVLREARLNLDDLLEPGRVRGPQLVSESHHPALPFILRLPEFPLLLPHGVEPSRLRYSERVGAVAVTRDGRLMQWRKPGQGARQVSAKLPRGILRWFSLEGTTARLVFEQRSRTIVFCRADLESGKCWPYRFAVTVGQTLAVHLDSNILLRILDAEIQVLDLYSGEIKSTLPLPHGVRWRADRFFAGATGWYALGWDGVNARLDQVIANEARQGHRILRLFDRIGLDGPWAVTSRGAVASIPAQSLVTFEHGLVEPVTVIGISPDGHRLVLGGTARSRRRRRDNSQAQVLLDLSTGAVTPTEHAARSMALFAPEAEPVVRVRELRRKFSGISTDVRGELVLVTSGGNRLAITLDDDRRRLVLKPAQVAGSISWIDAGANTDLKLRDRPDPIREFRPSPGPPETRYGLKVATWPDGSQVYLDSRGLLHLVSSRAEIPQLTIVLDSIELASCSLMAMAPLAFAGPAYYLGDSLSQSAVVTYGLIREFVETLP